MAKKERELKVYEACGHNYKAIPAIMLKGSWLREWGFEAGKKIVVECSDGELRIAVAEAS